MTPAENKKILNQILKILVSLDKRVSVLEKNQEKFATKEDLKEFATKEDLKAFATKEDLKRFATKEDLKVFPTKEDLKAFATKDDLQEFRNDVNGRFDLVHEELDVLKYMMEVVHEEFATKKEVWSLERRFKIMSG